MFAERLLKFAGNLIVLRGGMGARQSRVAAQSLAAIPDNEKRVLVATGRFDDARFDTLFLTLPISLCAGRSHNMPGGITACTPPSARRKSSMTMSMGRNRSS